MPVRTYGKIYLDEDKKHWKINNAEPHVCIKLKAIFAKLSAGATQPFSFDNTPEVCQDLLWFTERYPLAISEADMSVMKREKKKHVNNINEVERILLPDYQPRELTLNEGYQARHYQLTSVDVYMKVKRLLIGDDIGLGKTVCGILSCLHKETRPRRTRAEVGMELPPINKIVHTVGYDEGEVIKADQIARQLAIRATSGSFVERGQASRELDILVRQATGVSKARHVAEYVKILLDNNEPIMLAAWHRDVYSVLLEELKDYNPVMFTGSESPAQKEEAKRKFVDGETNLFIISLRSGIGLDGLQGRCNIVVIAELDWSPKIMDQLIGRIDRFGQKEQVTAIYLVSDYGSDPLIIDMLAVKSSQSHNIINPLTAVAEQYTDESRLKLLAEKFLSKKAVEA